MSNVVKFKPAGTRDLVEETKEAIDTHVGENAPQSVLIMVETKTGFTHHLLGDCYTFAHIGALKLFLDYISEVKRGRE